MQKKQKKSVLFRLLVLGFAAYMVITMGGLFKELKTSRDELARQQAIKEEKSLKINEYKNLLENGDEAQIIENAARERLGFVYADEQVYIDISGS